MEYEDFCELAALAVLDAIDERDILLVEECAQASPEFSAELSRLREAVVALPYVTPPLTIKSDLKARLFDRIDALEHPPVMNKPPFWVSRYADVNWQPHPVVPNVEISLLHTDLQTRYLSCLVRCQPGLYYPLHHHAGTEEILMLEGDFIVDGKIYGKGDYIYSAPDSVHSPETKTGCVFFVRTSLDDQFLQPSSNL